MRAAAATNCRDPAARQADPTPDPEGYLAVSTDGTLAEPPQAGAPPDRFGVDARVAGRYQIVRFVAAGGMGEVYEAEDLLLGARVALKALKASAAPGGTAVKRLVREIALGRKVTHPLAQASCPIPTSVC